MVTAAIIFNFGSGKGKSLLGVLEMISIINLRIFNPFFMTGRKKIRQTLPRAEQTGTEFEKIFQTYYQTIFRLCLRVTKDYMEAENITVKVFVEFYKESAALSEKEYLGEQLRRRTISQLLEQGTRSEG